MLKNCFSLPKLLYFLRTSTSFNHPALLEKYDKTVRDGLSKVCNVNFDDISSTQLALLAQVGGLGVSSASLLALPAFLTSAFDASDFLTTIFSETFEDVSFTKAFEKWLSLTNEQERHLDGTPKNWTKPVFAYAMYARSPSPSQRPVPTTIASRSPFPLGLCSCSTSHSKMGL